MNPLRTTHYARFVTTGCLLLVFCVAGSAGIQAYMGDVIPLEGYSYGSPIVYLFLTGPNLPANGVALDNINARADQGHFTTVDVDSNDHWSYKWGTNSVGGRLDAGTYTVWVSNSPNDRSRLLPDDYSTISVSLGAPSITVLTPAVPGTLILNATPVDASVVINGAYKGKTPLIIDTIEPGTYTVTFSHFGYRKFSTPVKVEPGKMTEVTATLVPETGSIAVNTSPAVGIAPVTLTNIAVGNHTLSLENEGFNPVELPVQVISDQITVTGVTLIPVSAHPTLPAGEPGIITVIVIACSAGVALVVFNRPR